jgi:hypothetical protein
VTKNDLEKLVKRAGYEGLQWGKDLVQAHWLCTLQETMIFEFVSG